MWSLLAFLFAVAVVGGIGFQLVTSFGAWLLRAGASKNHVSLRDIQVSDADSIKVHGRKMRLQGIDGPELRQLETDATGKVVRCGMLARAGTARLFKGHGTVKILTVDRDRYKRPVVICIRDDGTEINREIVRHGWAMPYLEYGGSTYLNDWAHARANGLGLHSIRYEKPDVYRHRQRMARS